MPRKPGLLRHGCLHAIQRKTRWLAAGLLLGASAVALGAEIRLPDGPGANLVYAKCQTCHDLQYVVDAKGLLPAQWSAVLASMKDYGLQINEAETSQVLQYLSTYLGSAPPTAAPSSTQGSAASSSAQAAVDGRSVFAQNCASCHGAEGRGQPGYYPPLAGNPDLARDPLFPVQVVLYGLSGPIEVAGKSFDSSMPAFAHLSDAEIAAVVDFVRSAWGNNPGQGAGRAAAVTPEAVVRQRVQRLTPADVHALRAHQK